MKPIFFLTIVMIVANICFATEFYRVPVFIQNQPLIVDVSLNRQDNVMIVSTGTTNLPKDFLPTTNYHDFNTSMKAFKHIDSGECLIIKTSETIGMVDRVLHKILRENFQQHLISECSMLNKHRLSDDEVEAVAGRRIKEFCTGYKSFTSISMKRETVKSATDTDPDQNVMLDNKGTTVTLKCNNNIHRNELYDNNCHIPDLALDIVRINDVFNQL